MILPVWTVGLSCLFSEGLWYITIHSCATWQGVVVHVVAVIWERLDVIVTGTLFCGLCVPD